MEAVGRDGAVRSVGRDRVGPSLSMEYQRPCIQGDLSLRVPTAQQGEQGKWPKMYSCQGQHREFGNHAKRQGLLYAQVENSLVLKTKDTAIFATLKSPFPRFRN